MTTERFSEEEFLDSELPDDDTVDEVMDEETEQDAGRGALFEERRSSTPAAEPTTKVVDGEVTGEPIEEDEILDEEKRLPTGSG